jgi:hypothetical protein
MIRPVRVAMEIGNRRSSVARSTVATARGSFVSADGDNGILLRWDFRSKPTLTVLISTVARKGIH